MKKPLSFGLASVVLTAAACSTGSPTLTPSDAAFSPVISAKSTFTRGLGCRLDRMEKLRYDDDGLATKASLPVRVDLRSTGLESPITNQGLAGACVGFSTVDGLSEYIMRKQGRAGDFAPRYIWNLARKQDGSLGENTGTYISTAMKLIDNVGLLPESAFPFPTLAQQMDEKQFMQFVTEKPTQKLFTESRRYRPITGVKQINSLHALKKSVSDGMPVVIGFLVYSSIVEADKTGMIPAPKPNDREEGGHAVVVVGYDNDKRHLIIRNSWSKAWGESGYGYLPYDYVKQGLVGDSNTAKI